MKHSILTNYEGAHGIDASIKTLEAGQGLIDAIESGVREVESNPLATTVGLGGAPNALGVMELDAAIMNGNSLEAGSVGALKGFSHPVSVARKIMETLPHVILVGEGAARFAAEIDAERNDNLSDEAREKFQDWTRQLASRRGVSNFEDLSVTQRLWCDQREDIALGTTVFIAFSKTDGMAGGTSTSGWAYKYPGRLGDSPVIGAGLYVDSRYGGAACTHTGEMTIRAGTSRAIVAYMKKGAMVEEACREAVDDLRSLQDGFIGPVVIHAMDKRGEPFVLSAGYEKDATTCDYCYWNDETAQVQTIHSIAEPY